MLNIPKRSRSLQPANSETKCDNDNNMNSMPQIVTLNVAGKRFQTFRSTLARHPESLLGNTDELEPFWNPDTKEYFLDRHRPSFDAILYYYQSTEYVHDIMTGKHEELSHLVRPHDVALDIFVRELIFYKIDVKAISKLLRSEGVLQEKAESFPLDMSKTKLKMWKLLEHPNSSTAARIVGLFSVLIIIISTVSFCLETLPEFEEYKNHTRCPQPPNATNCEEASDWSNPFFVIELFCIIWFAAEFILRFAFCPSILEFLKTFLNWVDFLAIAPFFINMAMEAGPEGTSFAVLRVIRLVRVFRIFKLSRHSKGLQILMLTFQASFRELMLLSFFIAIAVVLFASAMYFAESNEFETRFTSIPASFWYVIVTMTTVGYGDMAPTATLGKLIGSLCALAGVLLIALPVPVIVENFKNFYRQEHKFDDLVHHNLLTDYDKDSDEDDEDDI